MRIKRKRQRKRRKRWSKGEELTDLRKEKGRNKKERGVRRGGLDKFLKHF
jgi:hypothetical protein